MNSAVLNWISFVLIPSLTGQKHAPNVYITNAFYLNWRQLSNSMKAALPYLRGRCVDVGAGTAPYQQMVSQRVDEYIVADYSDTRQSMFARENSQFIEADVLNLPFEDQSMDSVLFTQVLEHVTQPARALDEIRRILKKEGVLIISVPFIFQAHAEPYDYWRFSEYGIRRLILEREFEILEFHYQGYFGTSVMSMLNGYIWQLSSKQKWIRNFLLLPFILLIFVMNNILGMLMDKIPLKAYSPNFFLICKKISHE